REFSLNIYPNPTDDQLYIDLGMSDDSELEVRVFDESGKNVWTNPFGGFRKAGHYHETLNTKLLAAGQYNLQIKTASGLINKKFTVAR
ncbi:MAG: T9SS type A sorting domain-containing protein, partial [Saprospiraceae bacterium]